MGSLHKGHISLVKKAGEHADRVVVSIFVNPTQFGPGEDFDDYPRQLDTDRRRLSRSGADVLFAPSAADMYPFGMDNMTAVCVPELATILCGRHRPGHFDGVTSVVNRLFNIVGPDVAVFGQKDYQQLTILRRMVADLHMPVTVLDCPTFREASGLAMSSRNQYLSATERKSADVLYETLCACRDRYTEGMRNPFELERYGFERLTDAGFAPEYLSVRQADDLSLPDDTSRSLVVLAAARLGATRLIDNVLFEL